jgi:hypothetical protein
VTMGLLRFNGYEESRKMFEERSGKTSAEAMEGGRSVFEEIKAKVHSFGLDTSGASLVWADKSSETPSLESYAA